MKCRKCKQEGVFSGAHKVCNACRAKAERKRYPQVREAKLSRYRERREEVAGNNRVKKYGLSQEEYLGKLIAQGGKCAICKNLMTPPCVDHNHTTSCVRSLLCSNCNKGLGFFADDPVRLAEAIEYLKFWQKK